MFEYKPTGKSVLFGGINRLKLFFKKTLFLSDKEDPAGGFHRLPDLILLMLIHRTDC